jgi:hypothetical protein
MKRKEAYRYRSRVAEKKLLESFGGERGSKGARERATERRGGSPCRRLGNGEESRRGERKPIYKARENKWDGIMGSWDHGKRRGSMYGFLCFTAAFWDPVRVSHSALFLMRIEKMR